MRIRLLLALILVTGLSACRKPTPSGKPPAAGGGPSPSAAEDAAEKEDMSKADWQLLDDSIMTARIEPWPPKEGPAQLKIDITADDAEQKFAGTLTYRLAPTEENSLPWVPLSKLREDEDGNVYYGAPITLPKGTTFIQFRVRDKEDEEFTELTDWSVEVK